MADIPIDLIISDEVVKIRKRKIDEHTNSILLGDVLEEWDDDVWIELVPEQPKKKNYSLFQGRGKIRKIIDSKLKITNVAISYKLKLKGKKCICPFHKDKDPSLTFNDDLNVFHCFGCHAKGDIIEFIRRMEELKNDN